MQSQKKNHEETPQKETIQQPTEMASIHKIPLITGSRKFVAIDWRVGPSRG